MDNLNLGEATFHMDLAFLQVLRSLLCDAIEARHNREVQDWYNSIESLGLELIDDMNKEEREKSEEIRKKLREPVQQQQSINASNLNKSKTKGISVELYEQLYDWEILMRDVMGRNGYKTKKKGAPGRAV